MLDFEGGWDQHLSLIEFAYNNSYQSTIQMAPCEALYGRKCRSPLGWFEVGDYPLLGPDMVQDAVRKVRLVRDRMRAAQSRQKSYADNRRREIEKPIAVVDRQVRKLRSKKIPSVKVIWNYHGGKRSYMGT